MLAALALRPGEVVAAERWPTRSGATSCPRPGTRRSRGASCASARSWGPAIETSPPGYRLAAPADDVDAQRFERIAGAAGAPRARRAGAGRPLSIEALSLWRGPALQDLQGWDPGRVEAERLDELRLDAEETRLEAPSAPAITGGLAEAQARVTNAPLRERRWALLALAQYQCGRQGEALRTLHRARTMLVTELGLEPGPELVALEQAILRQDPSLVVAAALPEPSPVARTWAWCPTTSTTPRGSSAASRGRWMPGTAGRGRRARRGRTVRERKVVARASGSGSRAAAPGPSGRGAHPGARPMDALHVLPMSGPAAVLVVDQCEEAVTLCDDPFEQGAFFAALADHAEPARWSSRCAPTASAKCRRIRLRPSRRAGPPPVERDDRTRPAGGNRGSGPPSRSSARARAGRPVGPRGRGRTGCSPAAVARHA